MPKPAGEVHIDRDLVQSLLRAQHPDLAGEDPVFVAEGWDNATWRLGDELAIRLPRRASAVELIRNEARWLPELAPTLPLPVPVPVRRGSPTPDYPWPWTVVRWFDGSSALERPPSDPYAAAEALGAFFAALNRPAPPEAPRNPYRGVPLVERDEGTRHRLALLGDVVDRRLEGLWRELCALPPWAGPSLWLHGDPHPGNLLVGEEGALCAVLDFGDVTSGDPASDLMAGFAFLPAGPRRVFREASGRADDDIAWERARGWALSLGLAYLEASDGSPSFAALARATLERVLDPRL